MDKEQLLDKIAELIGEYECTEVEVGGVIQYSCDKTVGCNILFMEDKEEEWIYNGERFVK